jgi:uncharacterized membrane protein (DUF4010 family)
MSIDLPPHLTGLLLALAIGFLIGIERGWRLRDEEPGGRVAGVRTFTLVGLIGGLVGTASAPPLGLLFPILAAATLLALIVGYRADIDRHHNVSATSTIAAILTLGLGALATGGEMVLASIGAGATVILLASRSALHRAITYTSADDIRALLRLVLVVFVILPLLPDAGFGPYGALNPQRLWMVVVVVGSVFFAGYVLARWLGPKQGTLVTALVGAIVSSTAVTLESARRMREGSAGPADEAAVALASTMMVGRALLLVALLAPFAFPAVAALLGPAALLAIAASAALLYRAQKEDGESAELQPKPPGLGLALLFAATVAAIALASAWAQANLGDDSGALVIALGGTADIDAAIAAVGALPRGTIPVGHVALALAAPVLFNTLLKMMIVVAVAGLRRPLLALLTLGATAGALAVPILLALL